MACSFVSRKCKQLMKSYLWVIVVFLGTKHNRYHHLKLYPEDESGSLSMKKPVVVESYDEIVFPDPSESFLARVQNHPALTLPRLPSGYNLPAPSMIFLSKLLSFFSLSWSLPLNVFSHDKFYVLMQVEDTGKKKRGDTKDHSLGQWFMSFSEADELLQLAAARQQVTWKHLHYSSSFWYILEDMYMQFVSVCFDDFELVLWCIGASAYCETEATNKFARGTESDD